ncbi:hypothetical protein KP509_14G034600 [Ceratopteris richardii]|nr:hypothetical protein KP509_14G034600 [Ceratopteris richardii]
MGEVISIKEELLLVSKSKSVAFESMQAALSSLNLVFGRVSELTRGKESLEAIADARMALANVEEQVALLKSSYKVNKSTTVPSKAMEKKSDEFIWLESKLDEAKSNIATLNEELLASKQAENVATRAVSESQERLTQLKFELEEAKSKEVSTVGKLTAVLEDHDKLKSRLEKVLQDNATLCASLEAMKADKDRSRRELESAHEKEHAACSKLAFAQDELRKVKEALILLQGNEAKSLDKRDTLSTAIMHKCSEAGEAKASSETVKGKVQRIQKEIEQAKVASSTANKSQKAALKGLETDKMSEAEMKGLPESEVQNAGMEMRSDELAGISILLEDYNTVKKAAAEAEGLTHKRAAEVLAQLDEVEVREEKVQSKLDETAKEADKCGAELDNLQKFADESQEVELIAECDLQIWQAEHAFSQNNESASNEESALAANNEKDHMLPEMMEAKKSTGLAEVMNLGSINSNSIVRMVDVEVLAKENAKTSKRNLMRRIAGITALRKKT